MKWILIPIAVVATIAAVGIALTTTYLVLNAASKTVRILVEDVPRYYTPLNEDLYLSGDFNGGKLNDPGFKLERTSPSTFSIVLSLPNGEYKFKFTRGTANSTEIFQGNQTHRTLEVSLWSNKEVRVKIDNWKDMVGNHTVVGTVNVINFNFQSPQLNKTKFISIYLPPDYYTNLQKRYPVIYLHDGQAAFDDFFSGYDELKLDEIMEDYYRRGKQASILVGIASDPDGSRMDELTPYPNVEFIKRFDLGPFTGGKGAAYMNFIVDTLKPYIDQNFRTKTDRTNTGILGSSLGGLISFYAGVQYQKTFGNIGAFSATYLFNDSIYTLAETVKPLYPDTRFYCMVGMKENVTYEGVLFDMITTMNKMVTIMRSVGYTNIISKTYDDGEHKNWFWTREFPLAYDFFGFS